MTWLVLPLLSLSVEQHGLDLVRAFPDPTARHVDEWSLLVDQAIAVRKRRRRRRRLFCATMLYKII